MYRGIVSFLVVYLSCQGNTKMKTQRWSQVVSQLQFSNLKAEIIWLEGAKTDSWGNILVFGLKFFADLHSKKWNVCDVCEIVMVLLKHTLASQSMMRWINNECVVWSETRAWGSIFNLAAVHHLTHLYRQCLQNVLRKVGAISFQIIFFFFFFKSQPLHDKWCFQALFCVHAMVTNEAPVNARLRS